MVTTPDLFLSGICGNRHFKKALPVEDYYSVYIYHEVETPLKVTCVLSFVMTTRAHTAQQGVGNLAGHIGCS